MNLILCPLKKEAKELRIAFQSLGMVFNKKNHQGHIYWDCLNKNTKLCVGGYGKTQFAIQAQFWIQCFADIQRLFCVGAAGALAEDIKPLDVVCATQVIEHDFKQKFLVSLAEPIHSAVPIQPINADFQDFTLHKGTIASGDEDIIEIERAEELFRKTKAIAVAWEGAGGARAAKFNSLTYHEVRGITDNARLNVENDFLVNLPRAMHHTAQVLLQAL